MANITGGIGNDYLVGTDLADVIDGGAGADIMIGGRGNDVYYVDNVNDIVVEGSGKGTGYDTVFTSVSYSLNYSTASDGNLTTNPDGTPVVAGVWGAVNVENLTLVNQAGTGVAGAGTGLSVTGNSLDNTITDSTTGGNNTLAGGAGNDTYYVKPGDVIIENANEGTDTVIADFSYTLGANVENLTLVGANAITGTGNAQDNVIDGSQNSAANVLTGGGGNDIYILGAGDTVVAGTGIDTIETPFSYTLGNLEDNLVMLGGANINGTGNALNNTITGNSGNNIIDGGVGADTMIGGNGNDTYYVDNVNDVVTEGSGRGSGTDTVIASVSFTLSANVENLIMTGAGGAAVTGAGNDMNNTIIDHTTNGGIALDGGAGNDIYVVKAGDTITDISGTDTVQADFSFDLSTCPTIENLTLTGAGNINGTGNALDNIIIGNAGANVLAGGAGNDTYYVGAGDTVIENPNEGIDTIVSSIDWNLATTSQNVENLTLVDGAIRGTGDAGNNTIIGNSNNNIIDGGAGADTMIGGNGNDTYYVDNLGDVVIEGSGRGSGIDTVISKVSYALAANVENLTLAAGAGNINGTGNDLSNIIIGNEGANVLTGGAGADILTGGLGSDTFVMNFATKTDTITDFTSGTDKLAISMAGISIGNGDTVINGAVTQTVPNGATGYAGFDANAELVVFEYNAANVTSALYGKQAAALEIGYASTSFKAGDTRLFVVDDGTSSAAYLFTSSGADALVSSNELTLLCTMNGCAATKVADYGFVA